MAEYILHARGILGGADLESLVFIPLNSNDKENILANVEYA